MLFFNNGADKQLNKIIFNFVVYCERKYVTTWRCFIHLYLDIEFRTCISNKDFPRWPNG